MQRITRQKYDQAATGLACKIILPVNQLNDDLQFQSSPLHMDKENLIEYWGEKDANLFVSKMLQAIQFTMSKKISIRDYLIIHWLY